MPDHERVRSHKSLRCFGTLLHDPNLWHLNRRSVATGVAIALFVACIPLPMHMLIAAALAIGMRANLPIAVTFVWINNPFTIVPFYYFDYEVGAIVMHRPPLDADGLKFGLQNLLTEGWHIFEPMMLGGVMVGLVCAFTGYVAMKLLWRWHVIRRTQARALRQPVKP